MVRRSKSLKELFAEKKSTDSFYPGEKRNLKSAIKQAVRSEKRLFNELKKESQKPVKPATVKVQRSVGRKRRGRLFGKQQLGFTRKR